MYCGKRGAVSWSVEAIRKPSSKESSRTHGRLCTYQHRCSKIEFVEELRYENVYLKHLRDVLSLYVSQHVDEPFKVLVRRTNPEKVDFLTGDAGVADEWGEMRF